MKTAFPSPDEWAEINALLDEALELPANVRDAWLEGLEAGRAVHRDALRELLSADVEAERGAYLSDLPELGLDFERQVAGLEPGRRIGPYRLLTEIGRGGMGAVWLAERVDGFVNRRIALKLPHVIWDDSLADRLSRETAILATLEHEHIARLYDAGVDEAGRPFLAMEFVNGESIDGWCNSHQTSLHDRLGLLLQVMAAVSHAHSRLIVHRDLKPGNILVTPEAQVKLLDFGIAKLLGGNADDPTALTQVAGRALTLDYASPEQIRGEALGTTSDVYSLGVVAYELLAGARPYRLKRGSAAEIEEAIANADPRLASVAATDVATRRALRGDLDAILNRALKKPAESRYQSVDAFAQDIQRYLRGAPVQAQPDSRRYRVSKFVQRNRLAVSMTAALSLAVIGGGGVSAWQASVARAQERRASAEASRQSAVSDLYVESMTRLSVLGANDPDELSRPHAVVKVLQDKLAELAPRMKDSPVGRAAQLNAVMLQLNYDNQFEASLAVGREYLALVIAIDAPPDQIIEAHAALGRTLFQLKRRDESETMRRTGIEWAPDADDPATVMNRLSLMSDLGGLLTADGRRQEALDVLSRAQVLATRTFPDRYEQFSNLTQLAILYTGFDDERAMRLAQQGHDGAQAANVADPDNEATDFWLYGNALLENGRAAEAEAAYARSLEIFETEYQFTSRNTVRAIGRLSGAIARRGDHARAAALLASTRERLNAAKGGVSPFSAGQMLARELENDWLAGDVTSAASHLFVPTPSQWSGDAIRDNDFLLAHVARAMIFAGRAGEAVTLMESMRSHWPSPDRPNGSWLRICEILATAQLAAGQAPAALQTANDTSAMLERNQSFTGRYRRVFSELGALAAARLGKADEATRLLGLGDGIAPAFASPMERADSRMRRAEVLSFLAQREPARNEVRQALAELAGQHAGSPRLVLARQLADGAAPGSVPVRP
ncbi:hypothetical protein BH09PSE6_BH09PSE6_13210 [soil metagenome]